MKIKSNLPIKVAGKHLSINKLIPNIMTTMALCCGLTAVRFAIEQRWEYAVIAILLAAILDNLDGRIARLIGGTSGFGAQLDSLGDVISFGVAPAMVMYFWALDDLGRLGWAASLLFVVCAAIRLARFNLESEDNNKPAYSYNYFTGMPTPASAGLALTPLVLSFQFGTEFLQNPAFIACWMFFLAAMMVSTVPTFSFKKIKIPRDDISLMLVGVGVTMAALFAEPWLTLGLLALVYLSLIPISYQKYSQQRRAHLAQQAGTGDLAKSSSEELARRQQM
jgi:CDP-diacylglycerol--serine O-phosphatidyltransferase